MFHFLPATMASADLRDELNCSICLNIYTDPVTLKCGHNFCKLCIGNVLDNQKESGIYSCPECRAEYRTRPKLQRNTTLFNIVERCRSTQPAEHVTGITCTYCVHAPVPAAKTCLHCEASLCETHLKVHSQSAEHVLTEPTTSLDHWKCSIHKEILKYYCTIDAVCICVSCSLAGDHRGHQVETLNEAHEKKKQRLRNAMDKQKKQRREAEKEIQDLTKHEKDVKVKADGMKEKVRVLIMDTRRQLEALEKKVLLEISMQEEQVSLQISHRIQELKEMKSELSKEMGDIEELQNMTDALAVLQARESFSDGGGDGLKEIKSKLSKEMGPIEELQNMIYPFADFRGWDSFSDGGGEALKEGEKQEICIDEISRTLQTGLAGIINGLKRNQDIIKMTKTLLDINTSPDITLDVNTASNEVNVSSDLKTVSWAQQKKNRPETPERFEFYPQVLSTRGFTSGRHYWEVETSGDGWIIGMAYPSIDRKGGQSYKNYNAVNHHYGGYNYAHRRTSQTYGIQTYMGDNKSWRLCLYNNMYSVMWGGRVSPLNRKHIFQKIGIFLDYEAGQLSFYELSDSHTHIHTFTARFTEPLHVAICVWGNATVKIIN
uniref:Uncharacterized protein n=1 Tax=Leptobrachium leishanense TaxID=445787 RepID=A0A8C5QZR0_9ANUR